MRSSPRTGSTRLRPLIERIADWAIDDDLDPQIGWRRVKGRLLARRGDFEEAERSRPRRSSWRREPTTSMFTDAHSRTSPRSSGWQKGKPQESASRLEEAMRLFELKGNIVAVAGAKARLEALAAVAPPPG